MEKMPLDPRENPYLNTNLTCIRTFLQSEYGVADEHVSELMGNVYEAIGTDLDKAIRRHPQITGTLVVRFYFMEVVRPGYSIDHNFTLNVRVQNGSFNDFVILSIVRGADNPITPDNLEHFQKYAFGK